MQKAAIGGGSGIGGVGYNTASVVLSLSFWLTLVSLGCVARAENVCMGIAATTAAPSIGYGVSGETRIMGMSGNKWATPVSGLLVGVFGHAHAWPAVGSVWYQPWVLIDRIGQLHRPHLWVILTPHLLIIDGISVYQIAADQSANLYEVILNRYWLSNFVINGNRAVEEWLGLFDDCILDKSALDWLITANY